MSTALAPSPVNETLDLTPKELWNLIVRSDREVRILDDNRRQHAVSTYFWKTKDGQDSFTFEWTQDGQEYGCDLNNDETFPVEVVALNREYVIWWYPDNPVRFVFVQPSF